MKFCGVGTDSAVHKHFSKTFIFLGFRPLYFENVGKRIDKKCHINSHVNVAISVGVFPPKFYSLVVIHI